MENHIKMIKFSCFFHPKIIYAQKMIAQMDDFIKNLHLSNQFHSIDNFTTTYPWSRPHHFHSHASAFTDTPYFTHCEYCIFN